MIPKHGIFTSIWWRSRVRRYNPKNLSGSKDRPDAVIPSFSRLGDNYAGTNKLDALLAWCVEIEIPAFIS
jgi:hypothetical protein